MYPMLVEEPRGFVLGQQSLTKIRRRNPQASSFDTRYRNSREVANRNLSRVDIVGVADAKNGDGGKPQLSHDGTNRQVCSFSMVGHHHQRGTIAGTVRRWAASTNGDGPRCVLPQARSQQFAGDFGVAVVRPCRIPLTMTISTVYLFHVPSAHRAEACPSQHDSHSWAGWRLTLSTPRD